MSTTHTLTLEAVYDLGPDATVIDRWFGVFCIDSEDSADYFGLAVGERRGPQGVCYSVDVWAEEALGVKVWEGFATDVADVDAIDVPEGVKSALRNEFALYAATDGYARA